MKYIVTQPFNDLGTFRQPGDIVEADDARAAKLRAMGLIGKAEDPEVARLEEIVAIYPESKEIPKQLENAKKKTGRAVK